MAADHRSIYPDLPGLPWWAAVVIATTATLAGIVADAGGTELTGVFAALYALGCVAAVLVVRQSSVFTAVIQPPLILFCAVPGAYWLFHGAAITGVKEILINCGYPLIERFPLMLFTSAGVLLIGMVRWYFGSSARTASTQAAQAESIVHPGRLVSIIGKLAAKITARIAAMANRKPAATTRSTPPRRRRADDRPRRSTVSNRGEAPRRSATPRRGARSPQGSTPTRSRHLRPPVNDPDDPRAERHRQHRAGYDRGGYDRGGYDRASYDRASYDSVGYDRTDYDRGEEPPLRRRPAPPRDSARYGQPPPEPRRDPSLPTGRQHGRTNPYRPVEQPRRAANGTHHPISQVRYRRSGPDADADWR